MSSQHVSSDAALAFIAPPTQAGAYTVAFEHRGPSPVLDIRAVGAYSILRVLSGPYAGMVGKYVSYCHDGHVDIKPYPLRYRRPRRIPALGGLWAPCPHSSCVKECRVENPPQILEPKVGDTVVVQVKGGVDGRATIVALEDDHAIVEGYADRSVDGARYREPAVSRVALAPKEPVLEVLLTPVLTRADTSIAISDDFQAVFVKLVLEALSRHPGVI